MKQFIIMFLKKITPISRQQSVYECLVRCNPGKDPQELLNQYYYKKSKMLLLTLVLGFFIGAFILFINLSEKEIINQNEICRENYSGRDKSIVSTIKSENHKDISIQIPISRMRYTKNEVEQNFDEAELWFLNEVLNENISFETIESDLYFPSRFEEKQIDLDYAISNYEIVGSSGKIHNENLMDAETVSIQVTYSYEQYEREKTYDFRICPKILSEDDAFAKNVSEMVKISDLEQREKEIFSLPTKIGDEEILYQEKIDYSFLYLFLLSLVCVVLLSYGMDQDVLKSFQERKENLLFTYPEFVSKLALLISAGMSVTSAMRRVYETIKKTEQDSCFTEELGIFIRNIDNGILVDKALEELGERTSIPQYRKFCSILVTNMKKGSINLKTVLNEEAEQSFILYQSQIRKKGEEASTKLLLPMIMMLGVVIAVILVPAFLTYQI